MDDVIEEVLGYWDHWQLLLTSTSGHKVSWKALIGFQRLVFYGVHEISIPVLRCAAISLWVLRSRRTHPQEHKYEIEANEKRVFTSTQNLTERQSGGLYDWECKQTGGRRAWRGWFKVSLCCMVQSLRQNSQPHVHSCVFISLAHLFDK